MQLITQEMLEEGEYLKYSFFLESLKRLFSSFRYIIKTYKKLNFIITRNLNIIINKIKLNLNLQ